MANDVLWRRLKYFLSPQMDLYQNMRFLVHDQDVLEIGFGTGAGAIQLARQANKVFAIEPDMDAVNFVEAAFPIQNIHWLHMDILDPDYAILKDLVDTVTLVEVLEHIEDWETALRNIHGLLKKDGKLIMTARNANANLRRNELHEREWTAEELVCNLESYFEEVVLMDHTMGEHLSEDTAQTPLIAIAYKSKKYGKKI